VTSTRCSRSTLPRRRSGALRLRQSWALDFPAHRSGRVGGSRGRGSVGEHQRLQSACLACVPGAPHVFLPTGPTHHDARRCPAHPYWKATPSARRPDACPLRGGGLQQRRKVRRPVRRRRDARRPLWRFFAPAKGEHRGAAGPIAARVLALGGIEASRANRGPPVFASRGRPLAAKVTCAFEVSEGASSRERIGRGPVSAIVIKLSVLRLTNSFATGSLSSR